MTASFRVPIDSDSANMKYESYFEYLLDGVIQKTEIVVDYHMQTNNEESNNKTMELTAHSSDSFGESK